MQVFIINMEKRLDATLIRDRLKDLSIVDLFI
jgi:hypothetical protein